MNEFELIVDNKVEIWRRERVIVKTDTLEKAIKYAEAGDYYDVLDSEYLYETETYLKPTDENPSSTCEIMDASGKILWTNDSRNI